MGGGHNFAMSKSPYDMPKEAGLRNFCGKCAEGPMAKVKFGLFLLGGLGAATSVFTSMNGTYQPRFATWNRPCGEYKGTAPQHH